MANASRSIIVRLLSLGAFFNIFVEIPSICFFAGYRLIFQEFYGKVLQYRFVLVCVHVIEWESACSICYWGKEEPA